MTTELKYTFTDDEQSQVLAYTNASERDLFLFEIFNNFFKQWRHCDEEPSLDDIKTSLFELKQEYNVII